MSARFPIKVVPASSRDGVAGWLGDTLRIRVSAPAQRGKANAAAERVVADALGVSEKGVRVVAGRSSAWKTLEVVGLSAAEVHYRLSTVVP